MDASGGFKIEKLSESNFHIWKQKIELVLAFREPSDHLEDSPPLSNADDARTWQKDDAKVRAVIGLSLSDEHLEHVRGVQSASEMWKSIQNLFLQRTLLNRLNAQPRFYTMKMDDNERNIQYINRAKQLAFDLKRMVVDLHDQEVPTTILCGPPSKFEHLIVSIDAVADDEKLTLDFVKSRLLQKEQRMSDRRSPSKRIVDSALVGRSENSRSRRPVSICSPC